MRRTCVASLFLCLTTTLSLSQWNPPLTGSQSAQNVSRRLVQRVATPPSSVMRYKSPVMQRLLAQKHNHQATEMSLTSGQDLTSPFLSNPPMYAAGSSPFDLALGNFTSDGKEDVIVAADPPVLLLGNGDGTFQAATQIGTISTAPTGVAVADFNRDGHLDAVFAITGGAVVYLGNGNGTFRAGITVSSGGTNENEYPRVLAADVNNDGIPDLILNTDAGISVLLGNGNGTFRAPIFSSAPPPLSPIPAMIGFMSAGDFNKDDHVDLAVTNGYNSVSIMLGNGTGTFTVAGNYSTSNVQNLNAIAIADYNRDGFQDVALPNGQIFLGNGNGTLQPPSIFPTSPNATDVAAVDVNGDGIPDLLTSSSGFLCGDGDFGTTGVSLGNGNGTFQPVRVYDSGGCTYPVFMAIGDLNNDSAPDIVVLNPDINPLETAFTVLINKGKGTFPAAILNISGGSGGVAVNDFNHDGNADVVLANGSVYLGHGDGTLQFKTSVSLGAVAVATGDFNRERNPDLAAAVECAPAGCSSGGQLLIATGNGNGTFQTPIALPSGGFYAESLAVADFNHDGNLDVALVNQCADSGCVAGAGSVSIFLGKGNGTFTLLNTISLTSGNPSSMVVGDFNNDGVVDLAIGFMTPLFEPGIVNILLGNGDGSFQSPTVSEGGAYGITALAAGDFNNDGILDLAVANGAVCSDCGGQGTVLYGNGDGTLTVGPSISTEGGPPVSAVAADFYGIGTPTPVLANLCGDSLDCPWGSIMINGSPWEPALDQTYIMLQFLAVGDFNNDGRPDLVGSLQYDAGVSVLLDTGATLAATTTTISPSAPQSYSAFQPVTFTAQVQHTGPGSSTGTVKFLDSGVLIGSAPVNCDGQASFTTTLLAIGSHFVVAYYQGDNKFAPSNSLGVHITVEQASTTVALSSSVNPSGLGQAVTFTATIKPQHGGQASGTVSFTAGGKRLGSATVEGNVARLTTTSLGAGTHSISAFYSGDSDFKGNTSPYLSQVVK
jgi:Bacterial Ig-like domain (group 3)/FG-GAP-like repeat